MNKTLESNGSGNGANGLLQQTPKTADQPTAIALSPDVKQSQITFQTRDGLELRCAPLHITRFLVVFELYDSVTVLRSSEVLSEFKIILRDRTVYSGHAVVGAIVDTGAVVTCEVKLDESRWTDIDLGLLSQHDGSLAQEFKSFINAWQKLYKILPEFKIVIADMQSFFMDLRLWLDQIELGVRSQPAGGQFDMEREAILAVQEPIVKTALQILEKFEQAAQKVEPDIRAAHMNYMRRQIHPWVLCAPFIHRTFYKPLGYAGDYEMVNMMVRDPYEGNSVFAKIMNQIFLSTPPVVAHRDRLVYLTELLGNETVRVSCHKRPTRIFNMGCGPAKEIQDFLKYCDVSQQIYFTLLDFNDETLAYASKALEDARQHNRRPAQFRMVKKSVNKLLKEASNIHSDEIKYDIVYCAGLLDYLADPVSKRLLEILYDLVAPGGLLAVTQVHDSNPSRNWMEYVLDWHLIYRNAQQLTALAPDAISPEQITVRSTGAGVNIFLEIRRPENA
ncbi:MAG TPA: class I SAM-dependent methyltransferase [Candidatus Saccharimonadales bacterium]|nr:class I SAM-dependent methyltransferase [Candidatus Saccharimonadales bacterium]